MEYIWTEYSTLAGWIEMEGLFCVGKALQLNAVFSIFDYDIYILLANN